jgi:GAF domain-containing protein
MADDLAITYRSLESQIAKRTQSLEKRSQQLEATAQVAREAAAIRKLDDLLTYTTHLIAEKFNFYHTGIFLLDDLQQYAILQAANSIGGQRMLARGHKLEIGQKGVVGYVAATGYPRIALDVGADAFFFDNPDLPETRSELALPLKVRDHVIGVLDVQSTEEAAFEDTDVSILQILADQLGLAINNTRLHEQSQEIINELQNAYQSQMRVGWSHQLRNRIKAYQYDRVRITPVADIQTHSIQENPARVPQIYESKDESILSVPLKLRQQIIGTIILKRDSNLNPWTSSDLSVVQDAMSQVAAALDNSRLLDESRRTAAREQLIGEITTKIRETLNIETIARTATDEIRRALDLSEVTLTINNEKPDL